MGLNLAQTAAVEAGDGPVLVLAGPGSGKTATIVARIAHLLSNGIRPGQIMVLTFTIKAAEELTTRLSDMIGSKANYIWAGTFHSICLRILRQEAHHLGFPDQFFVADDDDCTHMLNNAVEAARLDPDEVDLKATARAISSFKNAMLEPGDVDGDMGILYTLYQEAMFNNSMMDYDDLLLNAIKVFDNEKILKRWQKKFKHILVDEYQDTNHVQYILATQLSEGCRNLFVVGDANQSIYSFRGADITNIQNFNEDFPSASLYKLEQNYRSTKIIVDAVNRASDSTGDLAKEIWTDNPDGDEIVVKQCYDENDEAYFIVNEIVRKNYSLCDVAILARTHSVLKAIEKMMLANAVPHKVIGQMVFGRRKEVKDVLNYLKLVMDPDSDDAFMRVINVPKRGIGDSTILKLNQFKNDKNISLYQSCKCAKINKRADQSLKGFVELIDGLRELPVEPNILAEICKRTGYLEMLKYSEEWERIINVKILLGIAEEYKKHTMREFLDYLAVLDEIESDPDRVSLLTIHSAKGLEWPIVFVAGLSEDIFPHFISIQEGTVDEEQRLFYVAISRAMKHLYLTHTQYRLIAGRPIKMKPSRFIKLLKEGN
jgi:DNA helicase-2/ATP-dependent DNA helicase PcrA